jgi:glutathione S-transferase
MYQLYIANKNYSSWSLRPWVLMRECGIAFDEHVTPFIPGSNYEPFRKFSPTGKVPCLIDGDITVWDSMGIAEYLAERHANVWPADKVARAWARCAAAEMHSGFAALRNTCTMTCGVRVQLHQMPDAVTRDVARLNELWSEGLHRFGGPFLAGKEFSAVDAFFAPVALRVQTYQLQLNAPAMAYVARLLALPSMQQWYAEALAESWRDEPHEAEMFAVGKVIADYRSV